MKRNGWQAAVLGWPQFAVAIVANAVGQAALIVADPTPRVSAGFALLLAASSVLLLATVCFVVSVASVCVQGEGGPTWACSRPRPGVLVWTTTVAVLVVAASLLEVWVAPLVLVVLSFVLAPVAVGDPPWAGYRPFARAPARAAATALAMLLIVLVSWVVALSLGLLVTGLLGSVLTWLWFGVVATVIICQLCVLYRGESTHTVTTSRLRPRSGVE